MEGKKYLKFSGIILVIFGIAQLLLAFLPLLAAGSQLWESTQEAAVIWRLPGLPRS